MTTIFCLLPALFNQTPPSSSLPSSLLQECLVLRSQPASLDMLHGQVMDTLGVLARTVALQCAVRWGRYSAQSEVCVPSPPPPPRYGTSLVRSRCRYLTLRACLEDVGHSSSSLMLRWVVRCASANNTSTTKCMNCCTNR